MSPALSLLYCPGLPASHVPAPLSCHISSPLTQVAPRPGRFSVGDLVLGEKCSILITRCKRLSLFITIHGGQCRVDRKVTFQVKAKQVPDAHSYAQPLGHFDGDTDLTCAQRRASVGS